MGFEHSMVLDATLGQQAYQAFREYGEWVAEHEGEFGVDPSAASSLGLCPNAWFNTPEAPFSRNNVRVRDYFPRELWPSEGKCLLWWMEIPFPHRVPAEARRQFYRVLQSHNVLKVFDEIVETAYGAGASQEHILRELFE